MRLSPLTLVVSVGLACCAPAAAQAPNWFARYQARVARTQAAQPGWVAPVFTPTPRLDQDLRLDFTRRRNDAGFDTWALGAGRGPETIPFGPLQLTLGLPPLLLHTAPTPRDGFGDLSFLLKYRLYARNEQHGNAILTAFLGASLPTGSHDNGLCCATVAPTLALGKGWGRWDVVSTTGALLPIGAAPDLGQAVQTNVALQYHVADTGLLRFLWPELESNTTYFASGRDAGNTQSFLAPGFTLGRIPLHLQTGGGRQATLILGFADQIAVTRFHLSDHNPALTLRLPF